MNLKSNRQYAFFVFLIAAAYALPLSAQTVVQANSAVAVGGSSSIPVIHPLQISAGDLLQVDVFDTQDLSGKLRVDQRGDVALPLAGEITVAGLTAEDAAHKIEKHLHETDILKDPHVSVVVLEYATQGITIMGQVKNPGVYPLLGARNLVDVISEAGGVTPEAGEAITITHRDDPSHPATVSMGSAGASDAEVSVDIRPGDTVFVSHAGLIYVIGDVGKPGGFVIEHNNQLTVLQAVALAQGPNKTAALSHAKVIRKTGTGRQELPISLNKILANKAADETLYDGDILYVPSSAGKSALKGVEAVLPATVNAAIFRVP